MIIRLIKQVSSERVEISEYVPRRGTVFPVHVPRAKLSYRLE